MMLHAHTTPRALPEKEYFEFIDSLPESLDTEAYNSVALTSLLLPEADELNNHDPFGVEYRKRCENLYAKLSNNDRYTPELNERSRGDLTEGIWKASTPFSFKSTSFVSEFLTSWASIFSALDLKSGQSVLEYGAGSGQILLMLARTGIEAFGVDIDLDSLNLVRRQAEAMDLTIGLEQGEYGQGFGNRRFDAILFFESFHHALKFDDLLVGLHDRLLPGGRLVLCGEPVVEAGFPSVPYAWGPRLDGLSVFCMRRYGWMELGFQKDFLVEAMMRAGWLVRSRPSSVFRANTFIAQRAPETIEFGSDIALPHGWGAPEGSHRWTTSPSARLPLPVRMTPRMDVALTLVNHLPLAKSVAVRIGRDVTSVVIESGTTKTLDFASVAEPYLDIETELTTPPAETRQLGIAATVCKVRPAV
jgi:SAM-dependent methyltransferase